jgi:hypothetical protein
MLCEKGQDVSTVLDELGKDREEARLMLTVLGLWYRDLMCYQVLQCEEFLLNRDKVREIASLCTCWSLEDLLDVFFRIGDCEQTLERNVNPLLALEGLFSKCSALNLGASGVTSNEDRR